MLKPKFNTGCHFLWLLLLLFAVISCGGKDGPNSGTDPDEAHNPVLAVKTLGFYGVPGGDVRIGGIPWQTSRIYSEGKLSFSIQDPSAIKVSSLSGLPEKMKKGDKVSFIYKVSSSGVHTVREEMSGVEVLKVSVDTVWLRKDENTYFVIRQ